MARDNRSHRHEDRVADRGVVPVMGAKATSQPEGRPRPEVGPGEAARGRTQGRGSLSAGLARVNAAARQSRHTRFTALLHHVDEAAHLRAFQRQRRAASAGVDGVTVDAYEQNLESNLQDLCDRLHSGRYRPQPVRRTFIPKADGSRRPLGVPTLEDKIVQGRSPSKRSVKDACRRSPPGAMIGSWRRQQRRCPLSG